MAVTKNPAGTEKSRNNLARDHGTGFAKIAQNPAGTGFDYGVVVRDRSWDDRETRHEIVEWCRQHLGEHGCGAWKIVTIPRGFDMVPVIRVNTPEHHLLTLLVWG